MTSGMTRSHRKPFPRDVFFGDFLKAMENKDPVINQNRKIEFHLGVFDDHCSPLPKKPLEGCSYQLFFLLFFVLFVFRRETHCRTEVKPFPLKGWKQQATLKGPGVRTIAKRSGKHFECSEMKYDIFSTFLELDIIVPFLKFNGWRALWKKCLFDRRDLLNKNFPF